MEERLQKIIAQAGIASRRKAEELIESGAVTVNGKTAGLGDKADPTRDEIRVSGKLLAKQESHRYVVIFKKRGWVSSTEPHNDVPPVTEFVPFKERLYPVGRLDIDSDGLLILTNDGELTNKLTHPRYECEKTYKVLIEGRPKPEVLERWRKGVFLEGSHTLPVKIKVLSGGEERDTTLQITMKEGRNRQIRKIAEMLGHPVIRLTRVQIGPISIEGLKPGEYRELSRREVELLFKCAETPQRQAPKTQRPPKKRQ